MVALTALICVTLFPTNGNAFTMLKPMLTTAKNVYMSSKTVKDVNTMVKDANVLATVENAKLTNKTVKDVNTLVVDENLPVTVEDANLTDKTVKGVNTLVNVEDANVLVTVGNAKSTDKTKNFRFAVVNNYWEQQTNAILNMWSMQKWAKLMGFKVLEPFAYQSTLGITDKILYDYNFTNVLHFSDYFDLDFWTKESKKKYGIPPLEKWDTFVLAPLKKTVVVILAYDVFPVGEYEGVNISKHPDCVKQKEIFYNQHIKLFNKLQIQVVRNVCFAFNYNAKSQISLHQFNSLILPDSNVHVWFSSWRGIKFEICRIAISDHHELYRSYEGEGKILGMAKASPRVLNDSRKYVSTVLNTNFKEYTAVAFRTGNRRTLLVTSGHSREKVMGYFYECAKMVHQALLKISSRAISLSVDLGRFGDLTASGYFKINDDGSKLFKFILDNIYSNKSIDKYHNELIRAANGIEDSGYIGSMVKTIAENAKHLIVVGGLSSFQRSMITAFIKRNKNCQDCVTRICYD